jgi:hypothetical protein
MLHKMNLVIEQTKKELKEANRTLNSILEQNLRGTIGWEHSKVKLAQLEGKLEGLIEAKKVLSSDILLGVDGLDGYITVDDGKEFEAGARGYMEHVVRALRDTQ